MPTIDHAELEEYGFTVVRGAFDPDLCDRLRGVMDKWMGPPDELVNGRIENGLASHSWQDAEDHAGTARTVQRCYERGHPYITSSRNTHSMRHPIADTAVADAVEVQLEMQCEILNTSLDRLRLMQHFFRRTDLNREERVLPPKGAFGAVPESPDPGFHMDAGFVPSQYTTTPRSVFFHTCMALNDQPAGGACFMILPDAYKRARQLVETLPADELLSAWTPEHGAYAIGRYCEQKMSMEGLDKSQGVELPLKKGDFLIIDPMMYHAATPNTRYDIEGYSRYVLFSSYFDCSMTDHLLPPRGSSAPCIKFPPEMRAHPGLPSSLFDWVTPSEEEARAAVHARL